MADAQDTPPTTTASVTVGGAESSTESAPVLASIRSLDRALMTLRIA